MIKTISLVNFVTFTHARISAFLKYNNTKLFLDVNSEKQNSTHKTLTMIKANFTGIFILIGFISYAQSNFTLNSQTGFTTININGEHYIIDSVGTEIITNYPSFDSLIFLDNGANINIPIICNFKPDSTYSIISSCCGSLDIIPTSRLQNDSIPMWDLVVDIDKIQNQFMDKPTISINTRGIPNDSIYAWQVCFSRPPEYKSINSGIWRLGTPYKGVYWNNITMFQVFKVSPDSTKQDNRDLETFLQISNIEVLSSISLRLFDNASFLITFDEGNNNITLQYE